jgi:thioredoxin 1
MEHTFTDANFASEALQSAIPVAVDFWAEWCGPCLQMGPIVHELSEELDASKITIGKMNVDQNQDVPMKYGIMSIPTILVFKGGEVVEQIVGSMSKAALKEKLMKHV